MTVHH